VAIKFLSADLADLPARRRFQREAQTASSLNHPHILSVFDVGEHEGRQYLVTEFIDGGTLRNWKQRTNPEWPQILDLLTGVADGLACAPLRAFYGHVAFSRNSPHLKVASQMSPSVLELPAPAPLSLSDDPGNRGLGSTSRPHITAAGF
jgi:serine/threonine protein kinase